MLRISKNIKKTALSLLVVGLAIGFQSYKNAEKKNVAAPYVFYNTGAPGNTNTSTYRYDPDGGCDIVEQSNCSAVFIEATEPDLGDTPTGTQSGTILPGDYNGAL